MSTAELVLAVANVVQTIALAWIVAWQQRAAHVVRQLNGGAAELRHELAVTRDELAAGRPPRAPHELG